MKFLSEFLSCKNYIFLAVIDSISRSIIFSSDIFLVCSILISKFNIFYLSYPVVFEKELSFFNSDGASSVFYFFRDYYNFAFNYSTLVVSPIIFT